jgi:formate C-acetyltransferase
MAALAAGRTLHELGPISNICADWGAVLSQGLLGRREVAVDTLRRKGDDPEAVEFLEAAIETIDAVLALAARYAQGAEDAGRPELAEILRRVPALPPRTSHEALQSLRLCHAVVWLSGHYHIALGRFDQYLWPYLQADLEAGRLNIPGAEALLAEFFIALNKDSDLYPGVQQGDNGQSLMLGGVRRDGSDGVNLLTHMVLRVARGVALIDPKINLRITRDTYLELLREAAELTRIGLGFPQYSNDDVVIPGLVAHGYALEDARDYSGAACWGFRIPGKGMEVVNAGAVSLPAAVDTAIRAGLAEGDDLDGLLARTRANIREQLRGITDAYARLLLPPAPYYSVLMDGCLERGRDLSQGLKYNNFGVHGACAASAADALAAVAAFVYGDRSVSPEELLAALDADFEGYEPLRRRLRDDAPKVGNNDEAADRLLVTLLDLFADACEEVKENGRGGILRPGTGTAMYYVWLARGHEGMREPVVGATADGRRAGEFFGANLAPTPGIRVRGPISLLQSFAKIDYRRICNGGPITLELSDTAFRNEEALGKVALLIRAFAQLGGQQLQLNTLNVETLRDARRHPERHRNLIVRVWGWSGYFCELDEEYQEHIIARHAHAL